MLTREAYLAALLGDRSAEIAVLGLEQAETQLQRVQARSAVGDAAEFDLLQAEVQRDNQIPVVTAARNARAIAYLQLAGIANLPVNVPIVLTTPLHDRPGLPADPFAVVDTAGVVAAALENAGIAALREELDARRSAITVAGSDAWPALSLFANYSKQAYPTDPWPQRTMGTPSGPRWASTRRGCRCCWPSWRSGRAWRGGDDVYVNLAGGMSVDEPAIDLAVVAAVASSMRNRPIAPGTAGSLVGLLLFAGLRTLGRPIPEILAIVLLFLAGTWAATVAERHFGREDPGPVVIDEVVGMLVTLAFIPVSITGAMSGFLAFRVFDVIKRWPANRLEHLGGGLVIMADDVMAGVYAHLVVRALCWLTPAWMLA